MDASTAELPVLVGARGTEPEALLLIGPVQPDGRVRVRRWSGSDWSAVPAESSDDAAALFAWLEGCQRSGRSLNQALYALRQWLVGGTRG